MDLLFKLNKIGNEDVNESRIFDSSRIVMLRQNGDGKAVFEYPSIGAQRESILVTVETDEDFTAVTDLLDPNTPSVRNKKYALLEFNATGGKIIGTYFLVDAETGAQVQLPEGAIITRTWYKVKNTFTSATDAATLALGVATDSAAGIKAAIAISNGANPWDAGIVEGLQTGGASAFITLTADRKVQVAVAVEALTAGRLVLFVEYVVIS